MRLLDASGQGYDLVAVACGTGSTLAGIACELAQRLGVDYMEMRNIRQQHPDWPSKDLYVTFRKEFTEDPDKNLAAIPRKQRAVVRKGIKAGLKSETDSNLGRHYAMYSESLRNLGTPVFSQRYLEILSETFGDNAQPREILAALSRG